MPGIRTPAFGRSHAQAVECTDGDAGSPIAVTIAGMATWECGDNVDFGSQGHVPAPPVFPPRFAIRYGGRMRIHGRTGTLRVSRTIEATRAHIVLSTCFAGP